MDNPETYSGVPTAGRNRSAYQPPANPTPQPAQVEVDDSKTTAHYANFCRVTGTPEELIVDFGLNKQVSGNTPDPVQLTQRIIVNFYTAKRLAGALMMAVQRHEQAFGQLELDISRRVQHQQATAAPQQKS